MKTEVYRMAQLGFWSFRLSAGHSDTAVVCEVLLTVSSCEPIHAPIGLVDVIGWVVHDRPP